METQTILWVMIGLAWSTVAVTVLHTLALHVQARRRPPTPPVVASYRSLSRGFRRASGIMGGIFLLLVFIPGREPVATDFVFWVFLPVVLMCVVTWLGYASLARAAERSSA